MAYAQTWAKGEEEEEYDSSNYSVFSSATIYGV